MLNTLASLDSLVYLSPERLFVNLFWFLFQMHQEFWLPGIFITGKPRLQGVFITRESFWTPKSCFTDFKEHTTIFKRTIILNIDSRLYEWKCDLCLKNCFIQGFNWLPGILITGESITNSPRIFEKIWNRFWTRPLGSAEVARWKNRRWKISWPCPFKGIVQRSGVGWTNVRLTCVRLHKSKQIALAL